MVGKDIAEAVDEPFNMLLKVAGGEAQTCAEANWYRQIGLFRDGVTD
jgi:altronate dehydratase